jgi:hypothetical protein
MGLDINTLAVIRSLNDLVGVSRPYFFLKDEYRFRGGDQKQFGRTLERVVARWPECVEWDMRQDSDRRMYVWVRVIQAIPVENNV